MSVHILAISTGNSGSCSYAKPMTGKTQNAKSRLTRNPRLSMLG